MYKLTHVGTIIRLSDKAQIPNDPANNDYREFLRWVSEGNTPSPADPMPIVYKTQQQFESRITTTTDKPTTLFSGALSINTGYVATLNIIGVDLGNGDVKSFMAVVTCKRLGAGAMLVGLPTLIVSPTQGDVGTENWSANGGVDGNNFIITVTGAVGRTIAWTVSGQFISFTPNGN